WLATTVKERGALFDPNLGAKLSDADLRVAAPELVAIAKTWATQERTPWLIAFAAGLRHRLPQVEGLGAVIASARNATPYESDAQQLTGVLAGYDPARHAETLASALARYRKRRWVAATLAAAELDGLTGSARPSGRFRRRPTLSPPLRDAVVEIA